MSMRYWKVKLTCTTPVHIGSGEAYSKNSYIYDEERQNVYFLDEGKWCRFLSEKGWMDNFAQEAVRKLARFSIYEWLKPQAPYGKLDRLLESLIQDKIISKPLHVDAKTEGKGKRSPLNDVHTFIRNGDGKFYIPGSSIKGAMRTAILSRAVRKDPKRYQRQWDEMYNAKFESIKRTVEGTIKDIEKELANEKRGMVDSYFRGLSVSDAEMENCNIAIVRKWDLVEKSKEPKGRPVFRESLVRGSQVVFTVGIDEKQMRALGVTDWDSLSKILKEFVKWQCELLEPFRMQCTEETWRDMTSADLVLGGGTGFLSKTIIYSLAPNRDKGVNLVADLLSGQFKNRDDCDKDISPRTLKLTKQAGKFQIMGLCRLEAEELKC